MRKKIIIFLILISLISCNKNSSNAFVSKELIDSMSVEAIKYSESLKIKKFIKIKYVYLPVYVKLEGNSYVKTNPIEIYYIYERSYRDSIDKFNVFLDEVVNNGFKLNKNDFEEKSFNLNNEICKNFNKFEIKDFLNYYTIKDASENKPYLNKKIKNENEYLTISYLLFTKGYYLSEDDFRGRSYVCKFDDLIIGNVPN